MKRALITLFGVILLGVPAVSFAGECADVNNSGAVNLLDITYLINYLYKEGPAPDCGPETGTVSDIDGNTYLTIKIGDQWWMTENLKVTHYRNGDPISNVTDDGTWETLTTGAYCEYNNDIGNVATYGRLYNWFAVDDSRNIAPEGWHVPSQADWQILIDYLGGNAIAGGKMKEAGTAHWDDPNTGATNESGFTALPGGYRSLGGPYAHMGLWGFFWSSTEENVNSAYYSYMGYDNTEVNSIWNDKEIGISIRCIKD